MRGRLDAVLIAARVAPVTRHIGLVPVVVVTHTEPFHVSKAIATLDYVSAGRAGVQVPAADRQARLDDLAGQEYASDAAVFTGTPAQLAGLMQEWRQAGLSGFRLRPGGIPADLEAITRGLVPELQRRGVFRTSYEAGTLRGRLGLRRPASRYALTGRS